MLDRLRVPVLAVAVVAVPATAQGQAQPRPKASAPRPAPEAEEDEGPEITVTGQRPRGSVPGDIQPEVTLSAADIRTYGVSSVTDLLTELSAQTTSAQGRAGGRPVVLLNGRRISGFQEIASLPTEAIERVDILPEEAALRLGYSSDQRVVNFVLRRRFRAITAEIEGGGATGGALRTGKVDTTLLRIARDRRLTWNFNYTGATSLLESDRNLVAQASAAPFSVLGNVTAPNGGEIDPALSAIAGQPLSVAGLPATVSGRPPLTAFSATPNPAGTSSYRTLLPARRALSTNATYSRTIFGNVTATLNGTYEASNSESLLGLATAALPVPAGNPFSPFAGPVTVDRYLVEAGPRGRQVKGDTSHLGLIFNGDQRSWRWAVTGSLDRSLTRTLSDGTLDLSGLTGRIAANDPAVNPFARIDPAAIGPFGRDIARSLSTIVVTEATASGPLVSLPGGKAALSLKVGYATSDQSSRSLRAGALNTSDLGRGTTSAQASVDLPITGRRTGFLDAIGNLSLNGNLALKRLSDYGRLTTLGYGFNWSPIAAVTVIGSRTRDDGAPTVTQLGAPIVTTPDARVFDYVTGQSVAVTAIDGGNPGLRADSRRVTKLAMWLRPLGDPSLILSADYVRTQTRDAILNFPAPTATIEAAFPGRFTRDAGGRLLRVDTRPVDIDRRDEEQLRWGIYFTHRLGKTPDLTAVRAAFRQSGGFGLNRLLGEPQRRNRTAPSGGAAPGATGPIVPPGSPTASAPAPGGAAPDATATPPQTGATPTPGAGASPAPGPAPGATAGPGRTPGGFGGGGFGGGPGGARPNFGAGRLELSLYHTLRLRDRLTLSPGGPVFDALEGFALAGSGGTPRNEVQANVGATYLGAGARLTANWAQGTTVAGGTGAAPTDLRFAARTTINLRLFADASPFWKFVRDNRWLIGTRVALNVRNLLNSRPRVTDATGTTPISYQPDLLDPTGRTITLSIRKLLF